MVQSFSNVNKVSDGANTDFNRNASVLKGVSGAMNEAAGAAEQFGTQAGLATRRFAAFSLAAGSLIGVVIAFKNSIQDALEFERALVRISQVSGDSLQNVKKFGEEISR